MLRQRVLERVMDRFYEALEQGDENAALLAQTLGAGRDDSRLTALVLELYDKLQSQAHPLQWLQDTRRFWQAVPNTMEQTPFGELLLEDLAQWAAFWCSRLRRAVGEMAECPKVEAAYGAGVGGAPGGRHDQPVHAVPAGGLLPVQRPGRYRRDLIEMCLVRLFLMPALLLTAAFLIGIRGVGFAGLISVFASATAIASFTMTQQMGGDAELAGDIVVSTSALCIVAMFAWSVLVKALGAL